tara:strand:+ start:1031 stop:2095 length:1065 start_codon:yes stop_codon:yes gene_type:complete
MRKYYTRACNFYYGKLAEKLIKLNKALPLNGKKNLAFDNVEILTRQRTKTKSILIYFKDVNKLPIKIKKVVKKDLKKVITKRKNFINGINFSKTSIMGILNLTPDSFSDGGEFNSKNKSLKHISQMIKSGADIIDVGGESTRPGSQTISPDREWKRIEFVVKNFKKKFKSSQLSLDSRKSEVMIKGIKFGVDLINDVSGFNYDKNSLFKLKKYSIAKVLHHMQGTPTNMQNNPRYKNVLLDIFDFFENNLNKKLKNQKVIIDPGIGFGKTLKHNLNLISNISLFHSLGFPILIGTSRKRFIKDISGEYDSKDRTGGTLASVIFLLSQGVQVFRVHNVREVKQGIMIFKKILFNK